MTDATADTTALHARVKTGMELFRESPEWPDINAYVTAERVRRSQMRFAACRDETGAVTEFSRFIKDKDRTLKIFNQSREMCDWMDRRGIQGYRLAREDQNQLLLVGLHSGVELEMPAFRASKVVPWVAQQKRRTHLLALGELVQDSPERFRMWVIHDGPRCIAPLLRVRWGQQKKLVRKWNKSKWAAKYGLYIVFLACETGSAFKKAESKRVNPHSGLAERDYVLRNGGRIRMTDAEGRQTWHPHTHLLVYCATPKPLSKELFSGAIQRAQIFFGTPKIDQGRIKTTREVCKYLTKSEEISELPDDAREEHLNAALGYRTIETAGVLRERIKACKARQQMLRTTKGGRIRKQTNWNKQPVSFENDDDTVAPPANRDEPRLLAVLPPRPFGSVVAEPVVMYFGKRGQLDQLMRAKEVERLWLGTRGKWCDGEREAVRRLGADAQNARLRAEADAAVFRFCSPMHRNCPGEGPRKLPSDADGAFLVGEPPPGGDSCGLGPPENPDFSVKPVFVAQTAGRGVAESCLSRPVGLENPPQTKDPVALANGAFLVGANGSDAAGDSLHLGAK